MRAPTPLAQADPHGSYTTVIAKSYFIYINYGVISKNETMYASSKLLYNNVALGSYNKLL